MTQRSCRLIPHFVLPSEIEKILCKKRFFTALLTKDLFLKSQIYFLFFSLYFPVPFPHIFTKNNPSRSFVCVSCFFFLI